MDERRFIVEETVDDRRRWVHRNLPGHGRELVMTLKQAQALVRRQRKRYSRYGDHISWKIYELTEVEQ